MPDSQSSLASTSLTMPRLRRWPRLLAAGTAALGALAALATGAAVLWLQSAAEAALPRLDGDVHLGRLSAPVVVLRDAHGVPHINAATQDDLFIAQGYVTAQDRLWQMDTFRRTANGELAEILGPALLEHDRTERILGIRRTAERIYAHLDAADRRRFEDYARGVNSYIAQCEKNNTFPIEFRLLHYQPRPWTGANSISVGLLEVQTLDTHAISKLDRERVAGKLNDPQLENDLYPAGSWRDHPPTGAEVNVEAPRPQGQPAWSGEDDENTDAWLQAEPPAERPPASPVAVSAEVAALLGQSACPGCAVGSNEWVIAGSHTASGKPLLSNDMHLGLTVPGIWYMADLCAPGFHAAGVTLPGMPFIVAGHNEHVAWGFTALEADVQDLYIEKLDGKGNYQGLDAQWHPLTHEREVIHVRGRRDVVLDVQSTAHGPLVNSLANDPRPIALKWTIYDPTLSTIPLYAMNVAANWTEFSAALADWCWPTQNIVYSDDHGHIAYHAIGKVPMRGPDGRSIFDTPLPHDTMDLRFEWGRYIGVKEPQIYLSFDQMPNAFDPPSGFLATANARVTTNKSPYPLTDDWIDPYRVERIYKALDGRDHLTAADMLAVQTDIYSEVDQEMGQRFAYAIDHTPGVDARLRQAAVLLHNWDGRLTTGSAAASIITQARAAFWPLILKPKLGNLWRDYHWGESNFAEEEIIMRAKTAWLPPGYKDWNALLTEAVREGMKHGNAPQDVSKWAYGSWHIVDLEHPLARFLPLVGRIAGTGPLPMSGDTTTVKQTSRTIAPSQRFTMDWSNIDGSTENIVLGESGNPLSPYFRDQWNAWYNGTTFALPFTPAAVATQTHHTLRLLP